jgi:hypothetical protein
LDRAERRDQHLVRQPRLAQQTSRHVFAGVASPGARRRQREQIDDFRAHLQKIGAKILSASAEYDYMPGFCAVFLTILTTSSRTGVYAEYCAGVKDQPGNGP